MHFTLSIDDTRLNFALNSILRWQYPEKPISHILFDHQPLRFTFTLEEQEFHAVENFKMCLRISRAQWTLQLMSHFFADGLEHICNLIAYHTVFDDWVRGYQPDVFDGLFENTGVISYTIDSYHSDLA